MPCLGTSFPIHKIIELKNRGYQKVIVWLDKDKWREARHISDNCKWIGLNSYSILTEFDPKVYSIDEIKEFLK